MIKLIAFMPRILFSESLRPQNRASYTCIKIFLIFLLVSQDVQAVLDKCFGLLFILQTAVLVGYDGKLRRHHFALQDSKVLLSLTSSES